ncbi:MAG: DNA/RNA non-specific endonuclease [Epsilonproteobacteria bacterium]|nr:DNA/RNA non-specific endonuclease [Campylobacterota bacterium]
MKKITLVGIICAAIFSNGAEIEFKEKLKSFKEEYSHKYREFVTELKSNAEDISSEYFTKEETSSSGSSPINLKNIKRKSEEILTDISHNFMPEKEETAQSRTGRISENKRRLHFPINERLLLSKTGCRKYGDQLVDKKYYKACYNYDYKASIFVGYELDGALVNELNIGERPKFYSEPMIPRRYQANYGDWSNTGYDRGHAAPDASMDFSKEAQNSTYSLVNIWAQAAMVNRKTWIKAEKYSRYVAVKLGRLKVLDIAVFPQKPIRIGRGKVAVPYAFYKVLYNDEQNFRRCFYYENDKNVNVSADKLKGHIIECSEVTF